MKVISTLPEAEQHLASSHVPVLIECPGLSAARKALGSLPPVLKPCPFCARKPSWKPMARGHAPDPYWPEYVACHPCGILFRTGEKGVVNAVTTWNTRHEERIGEVPVVRKAFICCHCEGVYADDQVSQCDCLAGTGHDFWIGEIRYVKTP